MESHGAEPAQVDSRSWLPIVLGVEILLFLPSLVSSGIIRAPLPKLSESTGLFYPWALFWRDQILAGRAPFWNSYVFGGMPIVGEPQAHTFYPGHLLWLIFPPEFAFKLAFVLHILLASWLMYRLVRELGGNRFGASIAALAYGIHGQMIGFVYAGWIHQVMPMAWAPGIIWLLCRAFRSTSSWPSRAVAGAGLLLGIQIVSGHPEWVRYTLAIAAILTIAGPGQRTGHGVRRITQRLTIAIATVVLGLVISGVQLLPLVQATAHSNRARAAVTTPTVRSGAGLPIFSLPTVLVPRLFGPWDTTLTVDGLVHKLSGSLISYSESLIYVGVLPLMLAFIGWRTRRACGAGVWLAVASAGVLFALNDWTHLQHLVDRAIPVDAVFRSPARFVFLTNFALCVMAGLGASELGRAPRAAAAAARLATTAAVGLGLAGFAVWALRSTLVDLALARIHLPASIAAGPLFSIDHGRPVGLWAIGQASRALFLASIFMSATAAAVLWTTRRFDRIVQTAVIMCVAADLAIFAFPQVGRVVSTDRAYARDRELLAPLIGSPSARVSADHLNAFSAGDNVTMVFHVRSLIGYDSFSVAEWDRLWGMASHAAPADLATAGVTHIVTTNDGQTALAPVPGALGHVWWTDRIDSSPTPDRNAKVSIEEDVPGRLRGSVDSSRQGWLVFTEITYPGWTARVNGVEAPIARAFDAFQAVQVSAGQSTVEFAFRPTIVWWGLGMTAIGLAAAVMLYRSGRSTSPAARFP